MRDLAVVCATTMTALTRMVIWSHQLVFFGDAFGHRQTHVPCKASLFDADLTGITVLNQYRDLPRPTNPIVRGSVISSDIESSCVQGLAMRCGRSQPERNCVEFSRSRTAFFTEVNALTVGGSLSGPFWQAKAADVRNLGRW